MLALQMRRNSHRAVCPAGRPTWGGSRRSTGAPAPLESTPHT